MYLLLIYNGKQLQDQPDDGIQGQYLYRAERNILEVVISKFKTYMLCFCWNFSVEIKCIYYYYEISNFIQNNV